ncbi:MAG: hypothetical protein IPP32_06775 [Bacteroidetes bacterium]|nr:hypothetical protein [Bacteroidota bacterium]
MRIIAEVPHPACKISVFYMNQKYIVKFEKGNCEQSYKISELDYVITGIEDIKKVINDSFITSVLLRFTQMELDIKSALKEF